MAARVRTDGPWWAAAVAGVAIMSWLGLLGFAWSDYDNEVAAAARALIAGDVHAFLAQLPGYGGSLVLRAPFAGGIAALGGGELAVYRAFSIPCLVALALLALIVVRRMGDGRNNLARALVLGIFVVNPLTLRALEFGHPEELLCASLAIGAVLAAAGRRTVLAAILLGLAIATKLWAVLAIGPVLLALPQRRVFALGLAGAVSFVVLLPIALVGTHEMVIAGASVTGPISTPWQLFWFLGDTGQFITNANGVPRPEGWRVPPEWLSPLTHPLIALLVVPLSLAWAWLHRAREVAGEQLLLLLALLFLLRCILDPWNLVYYELPFLLALLTWEALSHPQRLPYGALAANALVWLTFEPMRDWLSPDMQSAFFLAWALPLAAWLGRAVFVSAPRPKWAPAGHPIVAQPLGQSARDEAFG